MPIKKWEKLIEVLRKKNERLQKKYGDAFPAGYQDDYSVKIALGDIGFIEKLTETIPLTLSLYSQTTQETESLHLRIFQKNEPIPLSDILPMLEHFGLRTQSERSYKLILDKNETIYVSDFSLNYEKITVDVQTIQETFNDAFLHIYMGAAENDGFNQLIFGANLTWRQILILRSYAKYLHQIGFRFSQTYIEKALFSHSIITKQLVTLFNLKFDPRIKQREKKIDDLVKAILSELEKVTSLDEDSIIRKILELIQATLRTNYFQTKDKKPKYYLSIKLNSQAIPDLPLPKPLYEIFVYSPSVEGIHLRYTKVARGGLRYSDRPEDYRTEVLGLMKAQVVKNAVIVPSGAKGGFVLKLKTDNMTREEKSKAVIQSYRYFVGGLLDLTDNIKNKKIVGPKQTICYDDHDPYLVVAADKGTATFSDLANDISSQYDFWLGDAFASGGQTGYDHKKIGITARGCFESIKRHFRELHIDVLTKDITVVGIGDMSGDVFGNGMIYSKHLKMLAAFDHRDIFIDPNPNPDISYYERVRMFNLSASSWQDYNKKLISKGGGVFPRQLKSIKITTEMKNAFDIKEASLTPNELIQALLKAPVDLLYNGGIGTYVKASTETHLDARDRANDYCRVDGQDLHTKVVGEGGNLGFTQLGRVEYALNGGLINTDFIDNSAGVDCSDHEVNLKILLNQSVQKNELTEASRNKLLASLTEQIADLVLQDNYRQALVMSFSAFHSKQNMALYSDYIKELESIQLLKRSIEYLPNDKTLLERKASEQGLTRPELAVLLAYTKIHLKQEILKTTLVNEAICKKMVSSAFPASIKEKYGSHMITHRLHNEIIATQLSNKIVNEMGLTFVYRTQMESGASIEEIIRAYIVASTIFSTHKLGETILGLDFKIPTDEQYNMLFNLRKLVNLSTRWFLNNGHIKGDLEKIIFRYQTPILELETLVTDLMSGETKTYLDKLIIQFTQLGLSLTLAKRIASYRAIYTGLNIIDVAIKNKYDLAKTAKVYFSSGEKLNIVWFRDQLSKDNSEGHWNALAKLTLRDELDIVQRALTLSILKSDKKNESAEVITDNWLKDNERIMKRWEKLLNMLHSSTQMEYIMFFITIRELITLITTNK